MKIIQIAPAIEPGTGVGGVAHHLEQEWISLGHEVDRITHAHVGGPWARKGQRGLLRHALHAVDVIWFSFAGTLAVRRAQRQHPSAITVCHNDAMAGDVYVNHGVLAVAMRARGNFVWRMVRNPLHLFTSARDFVRFRSRIHRVVISLTNQDRENLVRTYGRVAPRSEVIGNGVDTKRFRLPSRVERTEARTALGLDDRDIVTVFVGHEFERKGLPALVRSLAMVDDRHRIVVVGGDSAQVRGVRELAASLGVAERVHLLGRVEDPRVALWAADALALPSRYEAYQLVLPEAMSSGLAVISTRVGCADDIVIDGLNGWLTSGTPDDLARCLGLLGETAPRSMAQASRRTAESRTWGVVANQYLTLFREIMAERDRS